MEKKVERFARPFLCYFDVIFIYFTINFWMLLPALTT